MENQWEVLCKEYVDKLFGKVRRLCKAYRNGLEGRDAERAAKKYKSHRRISQVDVEEALGAQDSKQRVEGAGISMSARPKVVVHSSRRTAKTFQAIAPPAARVLRKRKRKVAEDVQEGANPAEPEPRRSRRKKRQNAEDEISSLLSLQADFVGTDPFERLQHLTSSSSSETLLKFVVKESMNVLCVEDVRCIKKGWLPGNLLRALLCHLHHQHMERFGTSEFAVSDSVEASALIEHAWQLLSLHQGRGGAPRNRNDRAAFNVRLVSSNVLQRALELDSPESNMKKEEVFRVAERAFFQAFDEGKQVLVPLNIDNMHWVLVRVSFNKESCVGQMVLYDSMKTDPRTKETANTLRCVLEVAGRRRYVDEGFRMEPITSPERFALQAEGDCGFHEVEKAGLLLARKDVASHAVVAHFPSSPELRHKVAEMTLEVIERGIWDRH